MWSGPKTKNEFFRALPTFGCPVLNPRRPFVCGVLPFYFSQAEPCLWMICNGLNVLESHGLVKRLV